ncbi:uncharacterized protein MONBRDRAFT_31729 [Monosiga brevicollis MX1]|uniref:Uncharacterized protein n=1 Tax=Monosiga brevicollis TaxID=81824 RepID=A9UUB0_MONBE|nr:uncharacterized protein MONBRDRAFT_31729 [Monosiga brevicollis MX1]EDQ91063.1 predicted protein [Monosiga brevicollis MX1]|eukprot:XP_001744360.1 hypothetical protein [Monosiga brevicollis MX1]
MSVALYNTAGHIVDRVLACRGSAKSLCLASKYDRKKALFALVCETLKYSEILLPLARDLQGTLGDQWTQGTLLCLVHDACIKGRLRCGGKIKFILREHKPALDQHLSRILAERGVKKIQDLVPSESLAERQLRFLRVNTLRAQTADVVRDLETEGWQRLSASTHVELFRLQGRQFACDPDIPDLLAFPAKTDLHDHPLYLTGRLIFQDKV